MICICEHDLRLGFNKRGIRDRNNRVEFINPTPVGGGGVFRPPTENGKYSKK